MDRGFDTHWCYIVVHALQHAVACAACACYMSNADICRPGRVRSTALKMTDRLGIRSRIPSRRASASLNGVGATSIPRYLSCREWDGIFGIPQSSAAAWATPHCARGCGSVNVPVMLWIRVVDDVSRKQHGVSRERRHGEWMALVV